MFSRRKPPHGYLLAELQQTYNDVSDASIKNLTLEDKDQFGEALKGWKALHTSLLYKIDEFERRSTKFSSDEASLIADLKAIRDENVKHLVRIQLRLDEQIRAIKKRGEGSAAANPGANPGANMHKMSIPSLRANNPASRSLNSTQQRHMVKSLRGANSGGYQMSSQNRDTVKVAANLSWARPKQAQAATIAHSGNPSTNRYHRDIFENFDQMEMPSSQYDHLNSVRSANQTSTRSNSPEPVNLIDLDDVVFSQGDSFRRSFEDFSISPKKKSPPPAPPSRRVLQNSLNKADDSSTFGGSLESFAQIEDSSPPKRPPMKSVSKSTSHIQEQQGHESKKYIYKQPQPMNISKMMQQSEAKGKARRNSATPSSTASKSHGTTNSSPHVQTKHVIEVKKSNITYNYKPLEKSKSKSKSVATRSASTGSSATIRSKSSQHKKASNAHNSSNGRVQAPASPYLNNFIDDYESGDEKITQTTETTLNTPAPTKFSGDMTPAEQASLIQSIRGIDEASAEQIFNDIVVHGDEVYWDDIVGLEAAKNSLKEAVVYPFLRPDLFRGLREPTRGMLLFGPPGTGKTMLARAVATESKSTFFSISSSSLTSKYLGESEKLVKSLFLLAKKLSPSIVFIDEIDSLLGTRNEGEVESMRRIKNEFLVQWSELSSAAAGRDTSEGDVSRVLILGATNLPWAIDEAARRRFAKRVYIPLPEDETRKLQISKLLAYQTHTLSDEDLNKLIDLTVGFSGSDITLLAKDSAMGPLRSLGDKLLSTPTEEIRAIQLEDFIESLKYIRPSVSTEGLGEYENWAAKFGSSGA